MLTNGIEGFVEVYSMIVCWQRVKALYVEIEVLFEKFEQSDVNLSFFVAFTDREAFFNRVSPDFQG